VCSPDKVKVIPLGFDLSRFREDQESKRKRFRNEYSIHEDELAIGIIGRLVPVKNHPMFIEAVKRISSLRVPQKLRFFIVGDGEERDHLLEVAKSSGIDTAYFPEEARAATLTFTSWRRDVDVVMSGLDIVALTSWNEGTPVSLIEAQAAGKPVITTDVGGIENAVSSGKTALLVPTGDVDRLVSSLLQLIHENEMRQAMSLRGWEFVKDRFHYTRLVAEMAQLYRELLDSKKLKS
ncbi:MAG: glycosyltransferase, partial [Bacteroidota bacterium]